MEKMSEDMDTIQTDLDRLFESNNVSVIGRIARSQSRHDIISTQDLKQIDYNLKSIRDYRKGRSTQLQMSGKYTFDFLNRSESIPQQAPKGLKTIFQRQRTVEDGYLPTRQFRPTRQNPSRIYAEIKSQKA